MSMREMGFFAWLAWLPAGPIEENRGFGLAGIEEQASEDDAVGVGGGEGGGAVDGLERGKAEAQDDGVGTGDADGFGEVVDAGREEEVLAVR